MGLSSKEHIFFVDEIKEIDFCENKVYQIIGSEYSKPTDFKRLKYEKHNLDTCDGCKKSYAKTFSEIELRFQKFPYCCSYHKKLLKENWFSRKDFENTPRLYTDKLFYTWHHILHFIDADEWREEIFDFIEYIFQTFGSFPIDYGEPLYFRTFTEQLEGLIKGMDCIESRKKALLEFIFELKNPSQKKKTDWNILIKIYDEWYRTFPFELSYFSHLKQHFATNIPLFEKTHFNKYINLTKSTLCTKESLINALVEVTDKIVSQINTLSLYESGHLTEFDRIKLELIVQQRKQKLKEGYSNRSNNPDTRYRRILKEWLKDEIRFIKEIEQPFKSISEVKNNLYTDIIEACFKMQENKVFWNADENTRTRQILDLLSSNYFTKDQATYGKSGIGKKQGSVDGVVIDHTKTEYFIEALNLRAIEKELLQTHINKLESNYDSKGLVNKFLLVYCNVQDNTFDKLCKSYFDFVNSKLEFKFQKIFMEEKETKYSNITVFKSSHKRESKDVILYHILLKMPV